MAARHRPPGPEATYGEAELEVLAYLWRQIDYLCSKRLKAALPIWLPHYKHHQGPISPDVCKRLRRISPATIDRLLAPVLAKVAPHGSCGTRPGTLLRTQIPIRAEERNVHEPGYLEADTVAHCGGSLAGSFVWSITYTDIWSGWTESRAIMYEAWQQPSSLIGVKGLVTSVEIRVQRDGQITRKKIARPSGNAQMDESVLRALEAVNRLPELPAGFGGLFKDITIDFELTDMALPDSE